MFATNFKDELFEVVSRATKAKQMVWKLAQMLIMTYINHGQSFIKLGLHLPTQITGQKLASNFSHKSILRFKTIKLRF